MLPIEEHLREMRVMHAQMTNDMCLLIIPCRAILALESRRLLALIAQMRQHRFFPLVQIVATRTLEHAVLLTADSAFPRINHLESPLPSWKSIWNPWKKESVLITSRFSTFSRKGRALQNGFSRPSSSINYENHSKHCHYKIKHP